MTSKVFFKNLNKMKYSYLFILPVLIVVTVFVFIPVIASLCLSFTEYDVINPPRFVGLKNYATLLFRDPLFWKSVANTCYYVGVVVPFGMCLALALAVLINRIKRFVAFFRTVYFLPMVTSVVAVSVVWKWLYAGDKYGLMNFFLTKLGAQPVDWLMNPNTTLPAIIVMSIWAGLGYNLLIFLAGLQNIPDFLYEAADIDGASTWQKFMNITIPMLKPTTMFVLIMSTITSFQVFEQVYIMTQGTEYTGGVLHCALTVVSYLYERGFQRFMMGYASAIAYLLFVIIFVLTIVYYRFFKEA